MTQPAVYTPSNCKDAAFRLHQLHQEHQLRTACMCYGPYRVTLEIPECADVRRVQEMIVGVMQQKATEQRRENRPQPPEVQIMSEAGAIPDFIILIRNLNNSPSFPPERPAVPFRELPIPVVASEEDLAALDALSSPRRPLTAAAAAAATRDSAISSPGQASPLLPQEEEL